MTKCCCCCCCHGCIQVSLLVLLLLLWVYNELEDNSIQTTHNRVMTKKAAICFLLFCLIPCLFCLRNKNSKCYCCCCYGCTYIQVLLLLLLLLSWVYYTYSVKDFKCFSDFVLRILCVDLQNTHTHIFFLNIMFSPAIP